MLCTAGVATAQRTPRDLRIEVRDKEGRPIADAVIAFFLTGDSTRTDSSGIATVTVLADTAINITVRKLGFEQRNARFVVGRAPQFSVRVALGDAGQSLPEVEVKGTYPGEPWRAQYEIRRKRGGGIFRDIAYFPGGQPFSMNDWFNGLPGVRTGGGSGSEINIPRCRNVGVWIDGQHATAPGMSYRFALQGIPPQDIAAFELYTSSTPAQYTGQNEDCSLIIWTRLR
ncbi:MAG TPA: carboxypeptidase regulatory-like domain-containing protein [Gemmatimonadaceae bacterium]|nr:carboxypeptidase regulatory-like domain-containing protein [Gemmatimonadaceae bacterium]